MIDSLRSDPGSKETPADYGPLDGVVERAGFAPGLTIGLGLVAGFLAFQGISLGVALVLILAGGGLGDPAALDISALIDQFAREFLVANTVGQVLGLAVFAWVLARLHTSRGASFLRWRGADAGFSALSIVGLIALVPLVQWLGVWSDGLPWPESIRSFEAVQLELIDQVLSKNLGLAFTLVTMAVTPAICEELFFRGYIQRQAERAFGGWIGAILFSGIVFGLYHVRLTQALPLSVLGIYLAYLTWRSGSLLPAILVHFANNAFAVAISSYIASQPELSEADLGNMQVPVYILIPAALFFTGIVLVLHGRQSIRSGDVRGHETG